MGRASFANGIAVFLAAVLWAAPAAAHPPGECRTTIANFAKHADAFEEDIKVRLPIMERLIAAWEEAVEAGSHAERHAVIHRHFIARFPELMPHLPEGPAAAGAIEWARKAIFCLTRKTDG